VDYQLESVKKNGPFSPILKGNTNFICVKSGLFFPDQDADAACAGQPADLVDPEGKPIPGNTFNGGVGNIVRRLGLLPGETQSVRIRQEFGDFRGALLQVATGGLTLTDANVSVDYSSTRGLARFFDCEDQRELEYCHPYLVGSNINYLPNTTATWLDPVTLEEIEWVIINQPGDAPRLMNFQANFGYILAMAGFIPSAEFYAPDPNPLLVGTPDEGILIRQQVLGSYALTTVPPAPATITSAPVTSGAVGTGYSYDVNATAYPGPISYSLDSAPGGMSINSSTGVISWTPSAGGDYAVTVRASAAAGNATQSFSVNVPNPPPPPAAILDNFNRADGRLGSKWAGPGLKNGYKIVGQKVDVLTGGPVFWKTKFGVDQFAAVTLTTIDPLGKHSLMLKAQGTTAGTSALRVSYVPQLGSIIVESKIPKKSAALVGTFPATLVNGDQLSAIATTDGRVEVFVNGVSQGHTVHVPYFVNRQGRIGLWFHNASNAWFDDFDGGNASVSAAGLTVEELASDSEFDTFEFDWANDTAEGEQVQGQIFMPVINNR